MQRTLLLVLCILLSNSPKALALGSDHPKGPVGEASFWPKGLAELANLPQRVHGFWVNDTDVFFFAGDTAALNRFLADYAKLEKMTFQVVLHPGPKKARSPWDEQDRDIPVDWKLYCNLRGGDQFDEKNAPGVMYSRVDVWLGRNISLDQLQVPANVDVVSGGEIERFVKERKEKK
ncbi:MAG: hypothetical protein L0Y72_26300 [Gemmataceae bacterium]|nr:hypothetical protein [Gemmataceae bacterium]MCI0742560.1 hypothetical protein [Gemmataceae bacterium]